MKKKIRIYPHPVLLIEGCPFLLVGNVFYAWLLCHTLLAFGVVSVIFYLIMTAVMIYLDLFLWDQCFGTLLITDDYIKYGGLFLPSVKIKFDDIKYMEIRTFKEGNVVYGQNPTIDAFKFILLSPSPLPSKRINKIHSSRRRKLIKFAVSEKLCRALEGKLEGMLNKPIEYQLFLYKRAKRK